MWVNQNKMYFILKDDDNKEKIHIFKGGMSCKIQFFNC